MKRLRVCIFTILLFLQALSTSWALQLSVNQPRYVPNEELVLTLIEDWAGEADVYVAASLPGFDNLYFITPPQNFVLDFLPYTQNALASGSHELLRMQLPLGLPVGEYMVFAAAIDSLGFFDMLGETQTSFIYALEAEPVALVLGDIRFPDGVIARRYSLALEPESGTPPYQFSVNSGSLPGGLTLDTNTGLIQGEPSARGFTEFTVQVVDGQGNMGEIVGAIKVYGVLTFGPQGTYQGCNGLQMAFNASQDLDEIRIQQGTYECNGLEIPSNKQWENGIKISGGWDGSFENQSDDPALTVFDGGAKIIADVDDREKCQEKEGVWEYNRCFQEEPSSNRILTVSVMKPVLIETLSFQNGSGGAIKGYYFSARYNMGGATSPRIINSIFTNNSAVDGGAVAHAVIISNCTFTNNSASNSGGAVSGANTITNSTFTNNSASSGGAISSANTITNSTFNNNSASGNGGAVVGKRGLIDFYSSSSTITNSIFTNNSASDNGGAVYDVGSITNSLFTNNSASSGGAISSANISFGSTFINITNSTIANNSGGGFYGSGTILNTIFAQNQLNGVANDITPDGELTIDYTLAFANNISEGVDYRTHNITGDPQFVDAKNGDFRLLPNSPCLDEGDSSVITACSYYTDCDSSCRDQCDNYDSDECQQACCSSCGGYKYPFLRDDNGNVIDLDGNPRVVGDAIDLGAFERQ